MQKSILIDTNHLAFLVVGLTNSNYISKHKNLYPVYTSCHFDILLALVQSAPKIICTAHILAETSNLLRRIADPIRTEVMHGFRTFLQMADEVQIAGRKATEAPGFTRLGLADAAIVSLDPRSVHIVSVDHDLVIEAARNGFDVANLTPFLHDGAPFA